MSSISYCVDVSPADRLRIRDLVLEEATATEKWPLVVDRVLLPQRWQHENLQIKALVTTNFPEAVLKLLNVWQSHGCERRNLLSDLRDCGLNHLAERICEEMIPKSALSGVWFGVPQTVCNFTGREADLEIVHNSLMRSHSDSPPGTVNVVYLTGLGGIGKSALASQLAFRKRFEYDGNLVWVNGENAQTILTSFKKVAGLLRQDLQMSPASIVRAVYNHFRDRKSLFIFDNVENKSDLEPFLYNILDANDSIPYTLVTSRKRDLGPPGSTEHHLSELEPQEAIELIQKSLRGGRDSSETASAHQLGKTLHLLPLALQQAVAYIKEKYGAYSKQCIDKYLKKFTIKKNKLLSYEGFQSYANYPSTPMTTWSGTLNCIRLRRGETAARLINTLSSINHEGLASHFWSKLE